MFKGPVTDLASHHPEITVAPALGDLTALSLAWTIHTCSLKHKCTLCHIWSHSLLNTIHLPGISLHSNTFPAHVLMHLSHSHTFTTINTPFPHVPTGHHPDWHVSLLPTSLYRVPMVPPLASSLPRWPQRFSSGTVTG